MTSCCRGRQPRSKEAAWPWASSGPRSSRGGRWSLGRRTIPPRVHTSRTSKWVPRSQLMRMATHRQPARQRRLPVLALHRSHSLPRAPTCRFPGAGNTAHRSTCGPGKPPSSMTTFSRTTPSAPEVSGATQARSGTSRSMTWTLRMMSGPGARCRGPSHSVSPGSRSRTRCSRGDDCCPVHHRASSHIDIRHRTVRSELLPELLRGLRAKPRTAAPASELGQ
mmetsp:Transcript_8632/g.25486  ORF Transcript_8632/g.25486 Transcript_8632/m.25486 type:complete len:222 (+) Transcript_8632:1019-1684(+)